jgi:hypothetical protein
MLLLWYVAVPVYYSTARGTRVVPYGYDYPFSVLDGPTTKNTYPEQERKKRISYRPIPV